MNVYDFDKTIYDGDSTVDFYWYVLKRKPALIRFVPRQAWGFFLYGIKKIDKTELKEYFFSFLLGINAEKVLGEFWQRHYCKICKWYLELQHPDDIVISASPEFLLKPICQRMGIRHLIASRVDIQSGKFYGKNCFGKEKVQRLADEYHVVHVDRFYSDSYSDLPMAQIATNAFLIKKGTITEWE